MSLFSVKLSLNSFCPIFGVPSGRDERPADAAEVEAAAPRRRIRRRRRLR